MTMKAVAKSLLAAAVVAMAAVTFSPRATAQAHPLGPLQIRQRAAEEALMQRQEAAARKKGNYNASYWKSEHQRVSTYWDKKGVH